MSPALLPARALIDPTGGLPAAMTARHWLVPLLLVIAAVAFSSVAIFLRWNPAPSITQELARAGALEKLTEAELAEKIVQAARLKLVGGIAGALFLMPLFALLAALGVRLGGWLIGRALRFADAFTAVCIALLPIALAHVLSGVVALSSTSLLEPEVSALLPRHLGALIPGLSAKWLRVASVVDFFNLWSAVLLGLAFSASTQLPRGGGLLFGLALYLVYAGVFLVGLPSL